MPRGSFWIRLLEGESGYNPLRRFDSLRVRDEADVGGRFLHRFLTLADSLSAGAATHAAAAGPDPLVTATAFATPTPGANPLAADSSLPQVSVHFGILNPSDGTGFRIEGAPPPDYVFTYTADFQFGAVYDASTMTLLRADQAEDLGLGNALNDILQLSGDFSAGFKLPAQPSGVDQIVLGAGHDYNLVAGNDQVAAGATLTVDAMALGNDGRVIFDGSAERDGNFAFFGSGRSDTFLGGAGDDRISGFGGADTLRGGGGSDSFVYAGASESSGPGYDTIADFTPGVDHIDLPGAVAGFAAPIATGALSTASFNADLGAVLGGLGAGQAVWFAPDAGDLAGKIFLVVDGNGVAGYQAGADYVFAVGGAPLADLTSHTDIFV